MTRTVVVGVGVDCGWDALAWATEEVASGGGRLVVCHACPPTSALADPAVARSAQRLEVSDPVLARALSAVRALLGSDRVALSVLVGVPGHALVRAAADADLLVIGADGAYDPPGVGATTRHVAHHARCPLVVVRPVESASPAPFAGHVVVGVERHRATDRAVALAFDFADRFRCPLAAVHVAAHRDDDYWYDDETLSTHFVAEPADLDLLAAAVEPWHHRYPHVPVKRAVLGGPIVDGLLRAGARARLLVLGQGAHGPIRHTLLGDVNVGVLDGARGTVAVAPLEVLP
jgi:nucleotide-binding universal stress UspA family protein